MSVREFFIQKWRFLYDKIVLEKASPEYIARGWSIGMFYGCLIPFGFQLLLSIPTSFILKGSKTGAIVGTFITNHFTVFVIYPVQCYIGAVLTGRTIPYSELKQAMAMVIEQNSFSALASLGMDIVIGFFVGGILFAAIMTPLTYFAVLYIARKRGAAASKKAASLSQQTDSKK